VIPKKNRVKIKPQLTFLSNTSLRWAIWRVDARGSFLIISFPVAGAATLGYLAAAATANTNPTCTNFS
jgi:hypothetical protein